MTAPQSVIRDLNHVGNVLAHAGRDYTVEAGIGLTVRVHQTELLPGHEFFTASFDDGDRIIRGLACPKADQAVTQLLRRMEAA